LLKGYVISSEYKQQGSMWYRNKISYKFTDDKEIERNETAIFLTLAIARECKPDEKIQVVFCGKHSALVEAKF